MKQPDDLIKQMQDGDEKAFSSLYHMYCNAIQGVILSIVREQETAEEVLQDVFVKVWTRRQSYQVGKGRFYTWLLNIARNTAIDKTRSKAYKNANKNLSPENFVNIIVARDDVSSKMDTIGIKKFIASLQPICIELIDLLYFKGFTQAETAKNLDTPLGTIKTRARNCMKQLRKIVLDK
ncbi:MAG: sigma-70 family RNA polymerase sigma factor [Bacteroidetes bacterium]|nr:sigma-70 family RNA polymerase sigma factor [Bacteroidota bacterium]